MMYLREFHLGLSQYQPEMPSRIASGLKRWTLRCLLAVLFCAFLMEPSKLFADSPVVTHEIRYHRPEASEVFLVWGVNGWNLLPEDLHPDGTTVEDEIMNTPMVRQGDTFVVSVQVPIGTIIDYGFWIVEETDDDTDGVWDGDKEPIVVAPEGFVTQEFRYYMPEASEVSLVWGVNGWNLLPEALHPAGTIVEDEVMLTPMVREHDTFVVKVHVPVGATIDYAFITTETRNSDTVEVWDGDRDSIVAMPGRVVGEKAAVTVNQTGASNGMLDVALYLIIGIIIILGIGIILYVVQFHNHRAVALTLLGLTLLGLIIRLWIVWNTNQYLLDIPPPHLSEDELVYNDLAYSLWQGSFFQWPGYASLYSLFLAVCYMVFGHSYLAVFYVQAFVGATVIPLTFLMARYFTGVKLSLLAAALVALHPALIFHTTRLSNEILYTPLLLLALLSLLWALKTLELYRFILAGVLLAVVNLCHPSAVFFPVILLLLLPDIRRFSKPKVILVAYYASAMIIVLVPWSLYNSLAHNSFFPLSIPGTSLWQGSPDFFNLMENKESMPQIWNEYLNPKNNGGYDPLTIEGDLYFTNRALTSITANPGMYALYSFLKLVFFWIGHPTIDWPDYTIFETEIMRPYFSTPHIAGIFATRLLPLITVLALIILHQVHGRTHSLVPLFVILGYFMLVHAITYPEMRYSEPLHPILVTIIAASMKPKEQEYTSLAIGAQRRWYFI